MNDTEKSIAPILTVRGLKKSFHSGRKVIEVLHGVNLNLHAGELTLLMGPSGSGKSTFLAAISGLQRPDEGQIMYRSNDIWENDTKGIDRYRLRNCGFIFQSVHLVNCLTARQQVIFLQEQAGIEPDKALKRADQAIEEVGLTSRAHLMPSELSGGEQQRVAIARTLAMRPKLIFADEPTSSLDSITGRRIVELLQIAARRHGAMVLCVTHDERIRDVADRIINIEDGNIFEATKHVE